MEDKLALRARTEADCDEMRVVEPGELEAARADVRRTGRRRDSGGCGRLSRDNANPTILTRDGEGRARGAPSRGEDLLRKEMDVEVRLARERSPITNGNALRHHRP